MTVHDTPKNELPQVEGSIVVSAMLANCKKRGQTPSLARWQCINMSEPITLIFSIKHHRSCAGFPKKNARARLHHGKQNGEGNIWSFGLSLPSRSGHNARMNPGARHAQSDDRRSRAQRCQWCCLDIYTFMWGVITNSSALILHYFSIGPWLGGEECQ